MQCETDKTEDKNAMGRKRLYKYDWISKGGVGQDTLDTPPWITSSRAPVFGSASVYA